MTDGNDGITAMADGDTSGERVRVLCVDDQAIIGEAVRRILATQEDIVYEFCQDPKAAIEAATRFMPTVILQDLVMPDVDGLDLVSEYRATESTATVPIVVLSSREEGTTKAEAFARGANDYIVKLPDALELIARARYHSAGYIASIQRTRRTVGSKRARTIFATSCRRRQTTCGVC